MGKRLSNILRGAASVLDVAPDTDYGKFVPRGTAVERIYGHWASVGFRLSDATGRVSKAPAGTQVGREQAKQAD